MVVIVGVRTGPFRARATAGFAVIPTARRAVPESDGDVLRNTRE